jgi:hypothetical protein
VSSSTDERRRAALGLYLPTKDATMTTNTRTPTRGDGLLVVTWMLAAVVAVWRWLVAVDPEVESVEVAYLRLTGELLALGIVCGAVTALAAAMRWSADRHALAAAARD